MIGEHMGSFFRRFIRGMCVVSIALSGACAPGNVVGAETVQLHASAHYLDPADHRRAQFGKLEYISGIEITSKKRGFGGYSGLIVDPDGSHIIAVSDAGHWLRADLLYHEGKLVGVAPLGELAPMRDAAGKPFGGKRDADAESIASVGAFGGPVLVGFERDHRVARYALGEAGFDAAAHQVPMPANLADAPANKGLETIALLADGSLLALTERLLTRDGDTRGWIVGKGTEREITVRRPDQFEPTDAAILPNGDLLLLERRFTFIGGPGMRIRRIAAAALTGDAPMDGETLIDLTSRYGIDNMEGLATRRTQDGDQILYVISDDNFSPLQKTLLLTFLLPN